MKEIKEFCKRIVEIEKWRSLIIIISISHLIRHFHFSFLVKLIVSNDRTGQIHRFCKRVSKSVRGFQTLSGRCFPLWSFRTHLLPLNSTGHSITKTNISVSNNLLSEVHCLLEGIHPGIRGTPPREGYLSIS